MSPVKYPDETEEHYLSRLINIDGESYEFSGKEFTIKLVYINAFYELYSVSIYLINIK